MLATMSVDTATFPEHLRLQVYGDASELGNAWRAFEKNAFGTLFQSYAWVSAWCDAAAAARGETPVIAVWYEPEGSIAAIWPMAMSGPSGSRVLTWLGQGYTNYNMGLYRTDVAQRIDASALNRMIEQLSLSLPCATALQLVDQPSVWNGRPNPFAALPQQPSANVAFEMPLLTDPDELFRKALSKDTRRRLERHERRLHEMHQAEFAVAQTQDMRLETLSAFLQQRAAQFERMGVSNIFADPAIADFYRILFTQQTGAHFESAYLKIDGEIIATSNGMRFQDRFYHLTLSKTLDVLENISPGRLLSREHVARQCRDGIAMFDFGPGGGMHKSTWHPNEISYFETYLPLRRSAIPIALLRRTLAGCRYAALSSPAIQRAIKLAKSSKMELVRRVRNARIRK